MAQKKLFKKKKKEIREDYGVGTLYHLISDENREKKTTTTCSDFIPYFTLNLNYPLYLSI